MGADMHLELEVREGARWLPAEADFGPDPVVPGVRRRTPFEWRSYDMFAFLAGVRNVSDIPQVFPRKDAWPADSEAHPNYRDEDDYQFGGGFGHSWLTLADLLGFDYELWLEDKRGEGVVTYREWLGTGFAESLEVLKTLGSPEDVRVLFYFT